MYLNKIDWIAIDWGTTNFRAWFIKGKKIIKEINEPYGIKNISDKNYENILIKILKSLKIHKTNQD